jgi:hypothetical protein
MTPQPQPRIHNWEIIPQGLEGEPAEVRKAVGAEVLAAVGSPFDPPPPLVSYIFRGNGRHPDRKIVELSYGYVLTYTVATAVPTTDVVIRIRGFGKAPSL